MRAQVLAHVVFHVFKLPLALERSLVLHQRLVESLSELIKFLRERQLAFLEAHLLCKKVAGRPLVKHHCAELLSVGVVAELVHQRKLDPAQQVANWVAAPLLCREVCCAVVDVFGGRCAIDLEAIDQSVELCGAAVADSYQGEPHLRLAVLVVLRVLVKRVRVEPVDVGNEPPGVGLGVLAVVAQNVGRVGEAVFLCLECRFGEGKLQPVKRLSAEQDGTCHHRSLGPEGSLAKVVSCRLQEFLHGGAIFPGLITEEIFKEGLVVEPVRVLRQLSVPVEVIAVLNFSGNSLHFD